MAQNWVIAATTAIVIGALVWHHGRPASSRQVGAHGRRRPDAGDLRDDHRAAVAQRRATARWRSSIRSSTATPVISLLSLNLLGKMGFGAFAGFEYVAIHAGECRNPVRSIARATAHRRADHRR